MMDRTNQLRMQVRRLGHGDLPRTVPGDPTLYTTHPDSEAIDEEVTA